MKRMKEEDFIGGPGDLLSQRPTADMWALERACVKRRYFIRAENALSGLERPTPNIFGAIAVRARYIRTNPAPSNISDTAGYSLFLLSNTLGGNISGTSSVPYFNPDSPNVPNTGVAPSIVGHQIYSNETPYGNHCVAYRDMGWLKFDKPHDIDKFDWALRLWEDVPTFGGAYSVEIVLDFKCLVLQ